MALVDDIKARFPEFDAAVVDQYVPTLAPVWPCYYGGDYDQPCDREIILNLVAHLLTGEQAASQSASRSAQSKSVGSVSVSYGTAESNRTADFFLTTKYGQRFMMLTQSNIGGAFV